MGPKIVYLSMGAFLESDLPTYSGGLEVLAGDTLRSCADLGIPIAGFIQASNTGYFRQTIGGNGWQVEQPVYWAPERTLARVKNKKGKDLAVTIKHKGRDLKVGAELYMLKGQGGFKVPVYLLDTNFDENFHNDHEDDREITAHLYDGNPLIRIAQENVLGQGSVKLARALGYKDVNTWHMNEGHACFATLELLAENGYTDEQVRDMCVFTTHTPVDAGHDKFTYSDIRHIVGDFLPWHINKIAGEYEFNTTRLAANMSRHINAVSRKHSEVSRNMAVFNNTSLEYITNGVHSKMWTADPLAELYDEFLKGWSLDPALLKQIPQKIPDEAFLEAKETAKRNLIGYINTHTNAKFNQDVLTLVWARRFADYKRPGLIFRDTDRLLRLAETYGNIQIVFAGKSHPNDQWGKQLIQEVINKSNNLDGKINHVFLPRYSAAMAKKLLAGADIWLNTPLRPLEASGTSGMKACHNGTINMSTFDGWWIEGIEMNPKAGFVVGPRQNQITTNPDRARDDWEDALGLYSSLEEALDKFYNDRNGWIFMMKESASLAGHFNTHRMVREYAEKVWNVKV